MAVKKHSSKRTSAAPAPRSAAPSPAHLGLADHAAQLQAANEGRKDAAEAAGETVIRNERRVLALSECIEYARDIAEDMEAEHSQLYALISTIVDRLAPDTEGGDPKDGIAYRLAQVMEDMLTSCERVIRLQKHIAGAAAAVEEASHG